MPSRRDMLRLMSASSLAWFAARAPGRNAWGSMSAEEPLLIGPAVVQQLTADGFAVSFAVSQLATGWVEWGPSPEQLDQRAIATRGGLIQASDRALVVPVSLGNQGAPGRRIFYRVVAQSLEYETAYKLHRGEPVPGPICDVVLPDPEAVRARVAVVNDTHEHVPTVQALAERVEAVEPDVLVWNGDTCASAFDTPADPPRCLLTPDWATHRALIFAPGNHDVRGACAREIGSCLAPGPDAALPYNVASRYGPLALVTLDTGEDKPDAHPVFGGTAAYEPYRRRQAAWLRSALRRPDIAAAPWKVVFCHIPLRGLPGQNDGLSLEGYAAWSGDGAKAWMSVLREERVALVVSGHMHAARLDEPADGQPMQVVGGGPNLKNATLIVLDVERQRLGVTVQDIAGKTLIERELTG